jgi:DNA ligase-1
MSPKIDGIRCVIYHGKAYSRNMEPIRNHHVRNTLEALSLEGCDGELVVNDGDFADTMSAIMSFDGEPEFTYRVFDNWKAWNRPFRERLYKVCDQVRATGSRHVRVIQHDIVFTADDCMKRHEQHLEHGFEGSILRDPEGIYKYGRVTYASGLVYKMKPTEVEEATIIGTDAQRHNANAPEEDALGRMVRSSFQDGLVTLEQLGGFTCRFDDGTQFQCGSGLTLQQRLDLWKLRDALIGRRIFVEYFAPRQGKPRFPIFKGFVR